MASNERIDDGPHASESVVYDDISLNRGPLHEQIADKIQDMVTTQRILPGEKLPTERDLAKRLGVSRPTIREAMRLMQHRGLVTRKPGGGTIVIPMGTDSLTESLARYFWVKECSHEHLMQVREILEPNAAALAAGAATPEDVRALEEKIDILNGAFVAGDPKRLAQADSEFHVAIAEIAGNPLLAAIIVGIDHLVRTWNEITSAEILDEGSTKSHLPILLAIKDGDPARAREAAAVHIALSRQVFQRTRSAR
jgi:GntR family transcriptional regulator, transcriptional repressor for pyruvate dehydrogenase complex